MRSISTLLRTLAVTGLGLMSTACIAVGSHEPLFSSADAGDAAQPRPGLWVSPDADCKFDPAGPATEWPECANGTVVRAHVIGPPNDPAHLMDYVLTGTDPRILQMAWPTSGRKKDGPAYSYVGVKPTRMDDQGRFVEAQIWIVLCGEQTPPGRNLETDRKTTPPDDFKPFAGLEWHKGDNFCLADGKDAVLAAAKASQGWITDPITAQWVRDTEN